MSGAGQRGTGRLRALAVIAAGLVLGGAARAQTRTVELVNADSVVVESDSTGTVRRLAGRVQFRQDTTALRAARAVQYVERGEVVLSGGVRIVSGRDTLTADRVTYDSASKVASAVGNVRIGDGTAVLRAPSATYASRERLVGFDAGGRLTSRGVVLDAPRGVYDTRTRVATVEGPFRLVDSTATLTALAGSYDARRGRATFEGDVALDDDSLTLTSARGTYDRNTRRATFEGDVRLVDSTAVLTSARGRYDRRTEEADFFGDVRLRQRGLRLDADSLAYERATERAQARGRVVLERYGGEDEGDDGAPVDSTRRTVLFGAFLDHDGRAGRSRVERLDSLGGLLVQIQAGRAEGDAAEGPAGASDTTLVRAPRLDVLRPPRGAAPDSAARPTRLTAWGGVQGPPVRLVQPRLAATADSVVFARTDSTGDAPARDHLWLYGRERPTAWSDEAQLTGDTIRAVAAGGGLDSLLVVGRAFAAQLDTTLGRVRQLRGRRLLALFDGTEANDLRRLSVWPNAEAVYYRATDDGRLDGADRLSADSLAFVFVGGELREIRGARGIEGTAYGPEIVPDPLRLDDYAWAPEARPAPDALLPPDGWEAAWLAENPGPPPAPGPAPATDPPVLTVPAALAAPAP